MPEIAVTDTPVRVADGLGIDPADLAGPGRAVLWDGFIENAGPAVVLLRRAMAAPNPESDIGSRLARGARRPVTEFSGGVDGGPLWVWCPPGRVSQLFAEPQSGQ